MKRALTLASILFVTISGATLAQITTTAKTNESPQIKPAYYDSTSNYLGKNVNLYIGQKLYLKGKSARLRDFGFRDFVIDINVSSLDGSNSYMPRDKSGRKSGTEYSAIAEKYFIVKDVLKHPKATENEKLYGHKYFLKLEREDNGDIVYFEYDSEIESTFPFLVVGYFEKLKSLAIGKEYVLRWGNNGRTDINTGEKIVKDYSQTWKVVDLTIEEEYYRIVSVLENENGDRILSSVNEDGQLSTGDAYEKSVADDYRNRFGQEFFEAILERQVIIGMTEEMCRLSWGEPDDINRTITGDIVNEQWVYGTGSYLYFENGILNTIQN